MSEGPTIRESMTAALATMSGEEPPATQGAQGAAPAAAGQEDSADGALAAQAASDARARDDQGRFAKPGDPAHIPTSEPASTAAPEPQSAETIRPPASLPAALKAEFATLPPAWQKAIVDQEASVGTAKAEWGKKGERLNRYEEIIGPHKADWQMQGLDEFQAVQRFAIIEKNLRDAPVQSLAYLARSYGVTLPQLAQAIGGGQVPTGGQVDPNFAALQQQFQTLQQTVTQQSQQTEAAQLADAESEIQAFAAKPENLYFHNVAGEIGRLLGSGQCKTLADAYETATWASPEVRPLLLKAQQSAQAPADPQAAQRAKAAAAAKAAGSVTGAPGVAGGAPAGSKGSIRADLEAALAQQGARIG